MFVNDKVQCMARKDTKLPSHELNGCTGHWIFRTSRNWKMACDTMSSTVMKPTQTIPMTWEMHKQKVQEDARMAKPCLNYTAYTF